MMTTLSAVAVFLTCWAAQGAVLQGTVQTADGEPLAARVTILSNASGVALDTYDTATNGTFAIEVTEGGLVAAAATATGYASDEIDLANGVPSSRVIFVLRPMRVVRGTVTDSSGTPQVGADVHVRSLGSRRRLQVDDASSAATDDSGAFAVAVPWGGSERFVLDVEAEGWVPQSSGVLGSGSVGSTGVSEGSSESVSIALESKGAAVSGKVTSGSGSAQGGVTVLIGVRTQPASTGVGTGPAVGPGTGPIRPYGLKFRTRAVTDSDGNYSVSGIPPGTLSVVAIRRGVRIPIQRFRAVGGGSYRANFVLP